LVCVRRTHKRRNDAKDGAWDTVGERQDFVATAKMTLESRVCVLVCVFVCVSVCVCVSVISSVRRP
jgi:hypothetical protein